MVKNLYWISPRESDSAYTGELFKGTLTFYGKDGDFNHSFCHTNEIRINHNVYCQEADEFILKKQLECIANDPDCLFLAYNPNCIYGAPEEVIKRTICLNQEELMRKLVDKLYFRELAKDIVKTLPSQVISGKHCQFSDFQRLFPQYSEYVVQVPVSSGGQGTHKITKENWIEIAASIDPNESYIVSGYVEHNIPVNIHAIIYDSEIVFFPGSIQIILEGNGRLLYRGADFVTFREIDRDIRKRFYEQSDALLQKIQAMGYRGVIGIDAMIVGDDIFFSEINNRFQGSSILLNKALHENGLESLQWMNIQAFSGAKPDDRTLMGIERLEVPYSMFIYVRERQGGAIDAILKKARREMRVAEILEEGYRPDQAAEPYASLFTLLFRGNITSLCRETSEVRLHPNVSLPSRQWDALLARGDLTALKTALINRGVILTEAAQEYIASHGQMRIGTYFSLDLFIRGIYVNSPLYVKLTGLSPFEIDRASSDGLVLRYYGSEIAAVDYDIRESFPRQKQEKPLPVDEILFFATDRLRVQNNPYCTFAKNGVVCKYCEASGVKHSFNRQDILDSLDLLFTSEQRPAFRHILIGGLSNDIGYEQATILDICDRIRHYTDMPIYLMCLPPEKEDIRRYYDAGVTEFGFNIEIFDREIARKWMPGKGSIPLRRYFNAFEEAVRLCGSNGAVRTAFIAGLEPMRSLLDGVEAVSAMGVAPILSAFRPIPGTEMEEIVPAADEWLYECLMKSEEICQRHGLTLGPQCCACRNNTLTIAQEHEVEKLYSSAWRRNH